MIKSIEHPETQEGEICLGNVTQNCFDRCLAKTKRLGKNAYDLYGNLIPNQYPIFVKRRLTRSGYGKLELSIYGLKAKTEFNSVFLFWNALLAGHFSSVLLKCRHATMKARYADGPIQLMRTLANTYSDYLLSLSVRMTGRAHAHSYR